MKNNITLCGGVFFTLLTQAARPELKDKGKWGSTTGFTEPDMFESLVRIIEPQTSADFSHNSFGKLVTKYKKCEANSSDKYFRFTAPEVIQDFDERVRTEYVSTKNQMNDYILRFIDFQNEPKNKCLIGTLQEIIEQADNISANFFMGQTIAKSQMLTSDIELSSFLLSVLHFIILYCHDNKSGKETLEYLRCENNSLKSNGLKRAKKLTVHFSDNEKKYTVDKQDTIKDCDVEVVSPPLFENNTEQSNQSQFIFNNYGGNPTNIVNTGFMSINLAGDSNNDKK